MSKKQKFKVIVYLAVVCVVVAALIIFFPKKSIAPTSNGAALATPSASATPAVADLSWPKNLTVAPKILMYHHVGPLPADADDIRKGLTVAPADFEAQLQYLKDQSFQAVTLGKMYEMVARGEDVSKVAVLTFDDGYDDNYTYALPALQKFNFTATFFIIASDMGKSEYMTSAQVKALAEAGNEIGSHTFTHPSLDLLSSAKVTTELQKSKATLEELTGQKVTSLCYPSGKFNVSVEKIATDSGYKIAVTTAKGAPFSTNNPLEVPRYRINPATKLSNLF